MPDLGILNILIAMVIVILVLSLVVQSIQTLTKKLLKLKSRSILNSLEDLFETITSRPENAVPPTTQTKTPKDLVVEVTTRLKEMGRKSLFGNPMLDSLAKGDLMKVLTRIKAEDLLPGAVGNFQAILAGIQEFKNEVAAIQTDLLKGEASAKFAAMQGSIMPLLHDLEALAREGNIDPAVFFGDLYKLRQIKAGDVLSILGEVQKGVGQDLSAAQASFNETQKALAEAAQNNNKEQLDLATERKAQEEAKLKAVEKVDSGLKKIANQIASLSTAFDAAFAPLFARLEQVEVWYDTVMQGFEERYTRHMRTVGIVISILVVVILNANFFSIYRSIKSDADKAAFIAQQAPRIIEIAKAEGVEQSGEVAPPSPTPTPASTASPARPRAELPAAAFASPGPAGAASPSASPAKTETPPPTLDDIKKGAEKVKTLAGIYESFGINPLSREQIKNAFTGAYRWRDLTETVIGWAIMVMLLSAGAPFWQDTLESLFGLKNLLRKQSDTKNVEEEKGGQPKP